MKECKTCKTMKLEEDYYKSSSGFDSTCKECRKERVSANRKEKLEYYQEYDRKRANNPDRVQARLDYLETEAGKESKRKTIQKYLESNPKKRSVHILTGNAIRDGMLTKDVCCICSTDVNIVAHHNDYDKPLEVTWVCAKHHTEWHELNGEGLNG